MKRKWHIQKRILVTLICLTCAILLAVALAFNLSMRGYIRSRVSSQLTSISETISEERRTGPHDREEGKRFDERPDRITGARGSAILLDGDGKIKSMRAFCKSTALSSLVYVTDPTARDEVYALLCGMRDEGIYGISRVFTREEAQTEERLAGDFEFVLESDGFSSFTNDWVRPIVRSLDTGDYRFGRATHGHLPEKGPQPTLIAFGPHIKAGAHLAEGRIVDDAPTFARILGIEPPIGLDGRAVTEIIRDEE